MVMKSKKTAVKFGDRVPVKKEEGVEPVVALHFIVYGDDENAPPKAVFTPYNKAEREELLNVGAARELDETERLVFSSGMSVEPVETVDSHLG